MSRSTNNSNAYEVKTTASQRKANRAMFRYAYEVQTKGNARLKAALEVKLTGKILIAENDPDQAIITKTILEGRGCECTLATTGTQAVALAGTVMPDLIITGIGLLEIDGLGVAERIRTDPKTASIPILIVSAKAFDYNYLVHAFRFIDVYLPKPIMSSQLIYWVDRLIK